MLANPSELTTNEKLMAAVAHAGIVLMPFGIALPAMVWGLQSKKSAYIRNQSAQALAFQIAYNVAAMVGTLLMLIISMIFFTILQRHASDPMQVQQSLTTMVMFPVIFLVLLTIIFNLLGVAACIYTIFGKDFRYPWIGSKVAGYLWDKDDPNGLPKAERLMTVLNHLTVFLPFWGAISPLLCWILDDRKDGDFRSEMKAITFFQIGQAIATLLISAVNLFLLPVGLLPFAAGGGSTNDSGALILLAGIMLLVLLIMLITLTVQIGFQTLGIIAAVRTWRGERYVYPLVIRFMKKKNAPAA